MIGDSKSKGTKLPLCIKACRVRRPKAPLSDFVISLRMSPRRPQVLITTMQEGMGEPIMSLWG